MIVFTYFLKTSLSTVNGIRCVVQLYHVYNFMMKWIGKKIRREKQSEVLFLTPIFKRGFS
jgi:hypothetical protein